MGMHPKSSNVDRQLALCATLNKTDNNKKPSEHKKFLIGAMVHESN